MSSIERLDSATVGVPLVVEETVIDITELILRSPLTTLLILIVKDVAVEPVPNVGLVAGAAVPEDTVKPVAVVELPPLVRVIAMFPTDTLSLRLLKVIL